MKMVRMTCLCGGSCKELTVTSAYLPYDSDKPPPTKKLRDAINYYCSRKQQIVIGCDANHIREDNWYRSRGESLVVYLASLNLYILKVASVLLLYTVGRLSI
jgi:hypothetical protein